MNHSNVFRLKQGDWVPVKIKEPPIPQPKPTPTKVRRDDDLDPHQTWMP